MATRRWRRPVTEAAAPARNAPRLALWPAVVVLTALNLRPFLTAVGSLSGDIRAASGLDLRAMAWLTLLPMLLMGAGAWFAPASLQRWGARRTVAAGLLLLALGSVLRLAGGWGGLLIVTAALCGLGVALVQGVFPGLIKQRSPRHVAPMMGLYSAALMGGGAFGAQLSPWAVQGGSDWRLALAGWALPALLAAWLIWRSLPAQAAWVPSSGQHNQSWLLRRPRTWLLMACFGLVNGGYAAAVAWLAPYYQARGWTAADSGGLVALMALAQAAAALLLPALSARQLDRRPALWLTLACQAGGFAALALWPDLAPRAWALLLGAGLGGCFALSLVLALDHLRDPAQAGALSAMMQGGGFMLAALAPWLAARLHDASGGFAAGWLAQLGAVMFVSLLVSCFAPQRYSAALRVPAA
jgi:CP family cyanate transporter-like MFS transporter